MIKDIFLAHPAQIGETYTQHWCAAMRFAVIMFLAAAACAIHAFIPACFVRTGSDTVKRLHASMTKRKSGEPVHSTDKSIDGWILDYQI